MSTSFGTTAAAADQPAEAAADRERFAFLLAALVAAFAVQGVASPGRLTQVLVSGLLGATLLLALWAARVKPALMRAACVLVGAVVIASVVQSATGNVDGAADRIINLLLVAVAPPAIVVGVLRSLHLRNQVTMEAVFGVLCLFLLLGMFFGFIYGSIDRLGESSFFANGASASVARCLYFSFTTLTTVGYGDLTAAGNLGHTISVSEALIGQIYLVTVVAVIVGNLGQRRTRGG